MANKKSTPIIVIGAAVFLVGGGLLFLLLQGGGKSAKPAHPAATARPTTTLPSGSVTFAAGTTPTTAGVIQFKVPAGQNAVAIQMDYFGGGGGYVRSGDKVNVYAIVNKDCRTPSQPAAVKLVFSNLQVLQVLGAGPAPAGNPTSFLVALSPQDSEKLLFQSHVNVLYFALTSDGEAPAASNGVTCANAF